LKRDIDNEEALAELSETGESVSKPQFSSKPTKVTTIMVSN